MKSQTFVNFHVFPCHVNFLWDQSIVFPFLCFLLNKCTREYLKILKLSFCWKMEISLLNFKGQMISWGIFYFSFSLFYFYFWRRQFSTKLNFYTNFIVGGISPFRGSFDMGSSLSFRGFLWNWIYSAGCWRDLGFKTFLEKLAVSFDDFPLVSTGANNSTKWKIVKQTVWQKIFPKPESF